MFDTGNSFLAITILEYKMDFLRLPIVEYPPSQMSGGNLKLPMILLISSWYFVMSVILQPLEINTS